MGARGLYLAQEAHIVNILPPVSGAGGKTCQKFNMKNYAHATVIIQLGVQADPLAGISVLASDNGSPENHSAIPFNLHVQETAGAANDVLGPRLAEPSTGYAPSGNSGIFYVLEIDADTLPYAGNQPPDSPPLSQSWIEVLLSDFSPASASCLVSAIAILSGARYAEDQSPTVTS